MAGIAVPNFVSALPVAGATRQAQVPDADWDDGMNHASCQAGVGINTGDYDPKLSDWAESAFAGNDPIPYWGLSQFVGGIDNDTGVDADTGVGAEGQTNQYRLFDPTNAENSGFTYAQALVATPPDAEIITNIINRTGKTIPSGSLAWGSLEIP